jgi:hypothetical protein
MDIKLQNLLTSVTATGAGAAFTDLHRCRDFTIYISASAVTSGATLQIESKSPRGTWHKIASYVINANGDTLQTFSGHYTEIRANITARTDGSYTVDACAKGGE